MPNIESKWYIHQNFNRNELRNAIVGSSSYQVEPKPSVDEKGLIYYDHILNHIMVWDGYRWRFTQYLDERDYVSTDNILLDNVWTQTSLIANNPGNTTSAVSAVSQWNTVTLSHITWSYTFKDYSGQLNNIIPAKYGSIYKPYIKDSLNNNIPDGFNNWRLEGDSIIFYGGLTNSSTASIIEGSTLYVSFLQYVGNKGTFNFVQQNSYNITNPTSPYDIIPFPYPYSSTPTVNNTEISINGLTIYDWTYSTVNNQVIIGTQSLGYTIDSGDKVWVQYII